MGAVLLLACVCEAFSGPGEFNNAVEEGWEEGEERTKDTVQQIK